ncbi:nucleotidyltransferase family protein [Abyssibius alkaniclasticus]|uniref:nucleotidyltransferase family protein n=1 Tax=Abyssibius alkaniclasticus TaxID=2881234 RepID=UPI0040587549|tara:strand:- start:1380 stop:2408 length:1029 start_codon:yes stop_codon:yes gene_type:complete
METFRYHSHIGQSAWTDLRRLLLDEAVSDLRGMPTLKRIGGRKYWYDRYRLGTKTVDKYIGEDGDALRARLERHKQAKSERDEARRQRSRLMQVLRAEGYLAPDVATGQIIAALAQAGVFRLGGTIVGTQAFRAYEGELGVQIGFDQSAQTDDIDIASFERLSLALGDQVSTELQEVFAGLKFNPLPAMQPGHIWRWMQSHRQTQVEFLTPSFSDDEDLRKLPALGVSAQSLHFLNYLIAEPITVPLLYRSGVLVQVPRAERYAIHKLIVATRRRPGEGQQKARKDRAQADFLVRFLAEERPDALAEAYQQARNAGSAWRKAIDQSLAQLPATAAALASLPG